MNDLVNRLREGNVTAVSKGVRVVDNAVLCEAADEIEKLHLAIPQWQPIETAPKDKTFLGLWWSNISVGAAPMPHMDICWWSGSWCPYDRKLTHWMPLPAPPLTDEKSRT